MFQGMNSWMDQPVAGGTPGGTNAMMIASLLGQLGGAVAPEGSWQQNLGNVAGNWGSTGLYYDAMRKGLLPYQQPVSGAPQQPGQAPQAMLPQAGPSRLEKPNQELFQSTPLSLDRSMLRDVLTSYGG